MKKKQTEYCPYEHNWHIVSIGLAVKYFTLYPGSAISKYQSAEKPYKKNYTVRAVNMFQTFSLTEHVFLNIKKLHKI